MSKIEIFKLFGSVFIDNDKANQSLDSTDQKAGGVGATLGKMGGFALKAGWPWSCRAGGIVHCACQQDG